MANILTPVGALQFPRFYEPAPRSKGSDPVYSGTLTFDEAARNTAAYKAMVEEIDTLVEKLMKEHKIKRDRIDVGLRDGDEKAEKYQGYAGTTFINPWSKNRPGVIGPDKEPIFDKDDVWSGQLARFNVSPYPWVYSGKYGVNFALNGVQIMKLDMPRLDGRPSIESMFDDEKVSSSGSKSVPF